MTLLYLSYAGVEPDGLYYRGARDRGTPTARSAPGGIEGAAPRRTAARGRAPGQTFLLMKDGNDDV